MINFFYERTYFFDFHSPYCGIFSLRSISLAASDRFVSRCYLSTDTSCVTGLPARTNYRSCRLFCLFVTSGDVNPGFNELKLIGSSS